MLFSLAQIHFRKKNAELCNSRNSCSRIVLVRAQLLMMGDAPELAFADGVEVLSEDPDDFLAAPVKPAQDQ